MKRLLKCGGALILIGTFLYSCVFHQITHMNSDELEWVINRQEGEVMYFKSTNGDSDTLTIKEVCIHNSLNPINWGYFNTSNKEYIATAYVRYSFKHNKGGVLYIEKQSNDRPIYFSSVLVAGWVYDVPLKTNSLQINGIAMNDIMLFNNVDSKFINQNDSNIVKNYAWSKKYGLVQYTLYNGVVFSREFK